MQEASVPGTKRAIVILIQVGIASLHVFRFGQLLSGEWYRLYYSYFSDVALPFGVYFLLTLLEERLPLLRPWYGKAGILLFLTTAAEGAQYFGLPVLGATFDPLDIVMYAVGVLLAALLEVKVLAPNVKGWAGSWLA